MHAERPHPGALADVPALDPPAQVAAWLDRLPRPLLELLDALAEGGHGVWIVGGAVRHALQGRTAHDVDLATTWLASDMLERIPDALDTGARFGTVTLRAGGRHYEATTLRGESGYRDGRHPDDVRFSTSLALDLERRDLTINAIAVDVARRVMHDPWDGRADLAAGRLRAVGSAAQRLQEDGLRLLRAHRFRDQGPGTPWALDAELAAAAKAIEVIDPIAGERLWAELARILTGHHAGVILAAMDDDGLLAHLLGASLVAGAIEALAGLPVGAHLVGAAARLGLLLDAGAVGQASERLRLSTADRRRVEAVVALAPPLGSDVGARRVWRHQHQRTLREDLLLLPRGPQTTALAAALARLPPLRAGDGPLMDGARLMESTSLPSGPALGALKRWLHRQQVRLDLDTAEAVLALLEAGTDPTSAAEWEDESLRTTAGA